MTEDQQLPPPDPKSWAGQIGSIISAAEGLAKQVSGMVILLTGMMVAATAFMVALHGPKLDKSIQVGEQTKDITAASSATLKPLASDAAELARDRGIVPATTTQPATQP